MKFFDFAPAPSPRRVRIFIAEKGLTLETVQVDLRKGEHRQEAYANINPTMTVPAVVLDNGTVISEAIACCRFLEAAFPEKPLMGRNAEEQGVIAMWEHRCEIEGFLAVAEAFRNSTPGMKGRALPGPVDYEQIPELAERGKARVAQFFAMLDERLGASRYVAGEQYSVADITAFVSVDFAGWLKLIPDPSQQHLLRWLDDMRSRPSAKA